ncbi:MAG: hypothetical protein M1828_000804 [Chrysothrix sp. TS-e1954]|nr:MAG: hypothetical protein M1828_000804 [Chrysothrix sp. TS-e1954]
MPSSEANAPSDNSVRQTYNFAPGYYGLVYRADVPDTGASSETIPQHAHAPTQEQEDTTTTDPTPEDETPTNAETQTSQTSHASSDASYPATYRLQSMKWGLVPFWTKRSPDYSSTMKTINCRDDSLASPGGMWATMKAKKRCIAIAQGFYEWLKPRGGTAGGGGRKVPHFVKRADGELMCFAGLWDCVRYEEDENDEDDDATSAAAAADPTGSNQTQKQKQKKEKLYTYTIITTSSSPQLSFLHDRMPVILDNGSPQIPYAGQLECYPVDGAVGKVGNNSPSFVVPVDSRENRRNIANFFGNQRAKAKEEGKDGDAAEGRETRETVDGFEEGEDNAPKPVPVPVEAGSKRALDDGNADGGATQDTSDEHTDKSQKTQSTPITSPSKTPSTSTGTKKNRSATSNTPQLKKGSPVKASDGSKKITSFFAS